VKRISAGEGLSNVAESIESAMSALAGSIESATGSTSMASPARKAGAISAIEKDEGLSEEEFDAAVELMMSSSNIANTYLAIGKATSCSRFLHSQLYKFHRA
jgi:hypothetical protein